MGGAELIGLDEEWLIESALDCPLVIILVFDGNDVRVLLILAAICIFIDPLAVIITQSIEVYPESALPIGSYALWPIQIDRNFIITVFNVSKSSARIRVSIQIIPFLLCKICFVILVFEHLSFDSEPAIRVSYEFALIVNGCDDFEVEV